VLTKDRAIKKLPITAGVQTEIMRYFRTLMDTFWTNHPDAIVFDGRYKPDDDEILEIPDFKEGEALIKAFNGQTEVDDFIVNNSSLFQIRAFFVGLIDKDKNIYIGIQKFDKRKIITASGFSLFYSGDTFQRIEGSGLSIDSNLTAILFESKRLRFKNFFVLKQIFDMTEYYKEATDHEIRDFGRLPSIDIPHIEGFIRDAKPWIKRKINMIVESNILQLNTPAALKKIADKISVPFHIKDGKISVPSDKIELKKLLQFLDEDIYQSAFSDKIWIANSKKKG
jgi:hypothetical protein